MAMGNKVTEAESDSAAELLAGVAEGDEEALGVLYREYAAAMLRLIRRLTANQAEAEEILQEAWLAVWQSAAGFRGDSEPRAWLLGVARRQAHNRLRRSSLSTVELDESADVAQTGPDVEDRVLAAMDFDQVIAGIQRLPEPLREVLDLVVVDKLSYGDIAQILGIPIGTVKSRMSQIKRGLGRGTCWKSTDRSAREESRQ